MHSEQTQRQIAMPPMPARIAGLPRDVRGYPIPWFTFVATDCTPDFRAADVDKVEKAVQRELCWVCGQKLGVFKTFVIGPMCAINRVTSEPPCHLECAEFSAKACPFLVKPRMKRLPKDADAIEPPGMMIDRNPGVTCLWTTRRFTRFSAPTGGPGKLFDLGEPTAVVWFAAGRTATLAEVSDSLVSGLPVLIASAKKEGSQAMEQLAQSTQRIAPFLPRAPTAAAIEPAAAPL